MRPVLQRALAQEPIYISLSVRWLAWLVALGIVLFRAAPPENLKNAGPVLVFTLLQLAVMTAYPVAVRRRFAAGEWPRSLEGHWILPVTDGTLALMAVFFTGGWYSPFYHFALTSILAPSLRFGVVGASWSSLLFLIGYFAAVGYSEMGFDAAMLADGSPQAGLISMPLNPLMVSFFSAFLGEALNRLRQEKERVRTLAAREERARMAREIHDGVSQTLFMLGLSLETGRTLADREDAPKTATHLDKLIPVARQALLELRNSMFDLGPLMEGEQPLQAAVQRLARDYKSVSGIAISLEVEGLEPVMESAARVGVYRMVLESLANACKHSQAKNIVVRLAFAGTGIKVSIEDDGKGFLLDTIDEGRGLGNLRRRAEEIGAKFELSSQPDQGTTVHFEMRIEQEVA